MLIAFHKPYGVLSQFTPEPGSAYRTLAEFGFPREVYPIGRLDADSEGLLLLSDEAALNARLLRPENAHARRYWVQVERVPTDETLRILGAGRHDPGLHDAALPRLAARSPARRAAARPAHPRPQKHPRLLARPGTDRRQKPAGAPYDRRRGAPDPTAAADANRHVGPPGRLTRGSMAGVGRAGTPARARGLILEGGGLWVVWKRAKTFCHPERSATTSKDLAWHDGLSNFLCPLCGGKFIHALHMDLLATRERTKSSASRARRGPSTSLHSAQDDRMFWRASTQPTTLRLPPFRGFPTPA